MAVDKIMSVEQAAELIRDGDTVACVGFGVAGLPEEVLRAIEARFTASGHPRDLGVVFAAGQGNLGKVKGDGMERFAHPGMLKRIIGGHYGTCPRLGAMVNAGECEAYNLPQGVITHLFRAIAGRKPGVVTKVGLKTFVDPRLEGGALNSRTPRDFVKVVELLGEEWLLYPRVQLDIGLIRGTVADEYGNVTMDEEAVFLEALSVAQAVKACGGKVIVQVKRIAKEGTLHPQHVKVPGVLVDAIVVAKDPEKTHRQCEGRYYDPVLCGHTKVPLDAIPPLALDERKIICRRAAMELRPGAVVNLGIGVPEGVASVAAEEGISDWMVLTVESGPIGGVPSAGTSFGTATNAHAIIDQPYQFDFYDGGGLDITYLGLAQVDQKGNVNVSKFGPRIPGCGGFINISQNSKKVVFCGSMTAGDSRIEVVDGKLQIVQDGKFIKFVKQVEQVTFSGEYAVDVNQPVLFVTERAVFELTPSGLELLEVAPGVDIERDVLSKMEFKPTVSRRLKQMPAEIFRAEPRGLAERLNGRQ